MVSKKRHFWQQRNYMLLADKLARSLCATDLFLGKRVRARGEISLWYCCSASIVNRTMHLLIEGFMIEGGILLVDLNKQRSFPYSWNAFGQLNGLFLLINAPQYSIQNKYVTASACLMPRVHCYRRLWNTSRKFGFISGFFFSYESFWRDFKMFFVVDSWGSITFFTFRNSVLAYSRYFFG